MKIMLKLKDPLNINVSNIVKYLPQFEHFINNHTGSETLYLKNMHYKILLTFEDKNKDGFTTMGTTYTKKALGELLKQIPQPLANKLVNALGKADFEVPQFFHMAAKTGNYEKVNYFLENK